MTIDLAPALSAARSIGGLVRSGSNLVNGIGRLVGGDDADGAGPEDMEPGSWKGMEFFVTGNRVRAGRRKAIHEYPFRDGAWVEDMGKRGRVYGFVGLLIGDDVTSQAARFVALAEQPGPGELVHPTFGTSECEIVLLEGEEQWDELRVWRFRAEFILPVPRGLQLQPSTEADTAEDVDDAADDADDAAEGGFLDDVKDGIGEAVDAVRQASAAVQPYVSAGLRLVGDASRVAGMVNGLGAQFGRYNLGRVGALSGSSNPLRTVSQVSGAVRSAVGAASAARSLVQRTGADLSALVNL